MEPRPRQVECLNAIRNEYLAGCFQQLIVMATGTGKTVVFSLLRKWMKDLIPNAKMLVFAHREELVDQAVESLRVNNPTAKVGKEMANDFADEDCDIIVSCVASIGRDGSTRLLRFGSFDIVVCDEAHHSIASTYLNVFEATGVLKPESTKLLVGFTATPKRKNITRAQKKKLTTLDDEELLSLKSVYKKIVFSYPIRKAIKEGWLVPLRGYRVTTGTDLSNVKVIAGDFQQDELAAAVNTEERNVLVLKAWKQYAEDRQTVMFSSGIPHAKALAKLFQENGLKFEAIWGKDPERASKIARHKERDITGLFNDQVLTEGYDDWRVSCIGMTAPTRSSTKYTQEIGRGTRLQEGTGNLFYALEKGYALTKQDCIVLDFVDNAKYNSLVTLPSLLGLNPDMDLKGKSVTYVADKMDELQDKYPTISLAHITDIDKVQAYIESMDLFSAPYTEEVKEFSKLTWMAVADGSYVLAIPEKKELKGQFARYLHEKLHVTPNELDEFVLSITSTKQEKELGIYNSLKEAFESADEVVQRCRGDRMSVMVREAEWHLRPASDPAKKLLKTLSKRKPVLRCLCPGIHTQGKNCLICKLPQGITAGEASTAINLLQARKK